jgi:hypothetical protein
MLPFSSNLKIYLFKDRQLVSLSIKVSDNCVNSYDLAISDFEKILDSWDKQGFDDRLGPAWWSVCHKKSTPRPECASANYVRISVSINNQNFHYRVDYTDMYQVKKDYFYQKNNVMYWDNNV